MQVENINDNNILLIKKFIQKIPNLEVEEDILSKATILKEDGSVKGMISYEVYSDKGLIRYFIFQKDVSFDNLTNLFNKMLENAKEEGIKKIITVIQQSELILFFEQLGFVLLPVDGIYIGETSLKNTIYEQAIGMIYDVEKISNLNG